MMQIPSLPISFSSVDLEAFCQRWQVLELALFGSVLRPDFGKESDIDVLLSLAPEHHISANDWLAMADELEAIFGRHVDMLDRQALLHSANYLRRQHILDSAQVLYAR